MRDGFWLALLVVASIGLVLQAQHIAHLELHANNQHTEIAALRDDIDTLVVQVGARDALLREVRRDLDRQREQTDRWAKMALEAEQCE